MIFLKLNLNFPKIQKSSLFFGEREKEEERVADRQRQRQEERQGKIDEERDRNREHIRAYNHIYNLSERKMRQFSQIHRFRSQLFWISGNSHVPTPQPT